MDVNKFSSKMTKLLTMQKDYERIKSENLLFRQQIDDLNKKLDTQKETHQKELVKISMGKVSPISITEKIIDDCYVRLEDMSDKIRYFEERDLDNSTCTSSPYYTEESERIEREQDIRMSMIRDIITMLEKAAGIEG